MKTPEMTYEKPIPAHQLAPIAGAIASAEGWRHPDSGELLVAMKGLTPNSSIKEGEKPADEVTVTPQADEIVGEKSTTSDEAMPAIVDEKKIEGPVLFSFAPVKNGFTATLLAPNQDKRTRWTINGNEAESRGNTCAVPADADIVATNPSKGTFNGRSPKSE